MIRDYTECSNEGLILPEAAVQVNIEEPLRHLFAAGRTDRLGRTFLPLYTMRCNKQGTANILHKGTIPYMYDIMQDEVNFFIPIFLTV